MKRKTARVTAILMAVLLLLGTGYAGRAHATEPDGNEANEAAETLSVPTLANIAVIGSTDICDAELAALFGAKYQKYDFAPLKEADAVFQPTETPDAVFILTTEEDTVTKEEGKPTVYLGSMKIRTIHRVIADAVPEGTPIAWVTYATDGNSVAKQFENLQNAEDALPEDSLFTSYCFFEKDADSALREKTARRTVGPLLGDGMFYEAPEEKQYNDIVYYVFEDGNDKADGRTPQTAMKTINAASKKLITAHGNNMATFNENDRIVFEVSGHVQHSTSQTVLAISKTNTPRTADGTPIPVVCETYQYDPQLDNRATIYTTYLPHDTGSSRIDVPFMLTLKDVCFSSEPKSTTGTIPYSCYNFWITETTVTFDNVTFANATNQPWVISASNNVFSDSYNVPEGEEPRRIEHHLIFKSGVYDETTGVSYVAANASSSQWRDAAKGGTINEAYNQYSYVTVEKGAYVGQLFGLSNKCPWGGAEINVLPGGKVGILGVMRDASSGMAVDITDTIDINVYGEITKEIHGLGQRTDLIGDFNINVQNAKLLGHPEKSDDCSWDFLGASDSTLEGNAKTEIKNSLICMFAGLNAPSAILPGGYYTVVDGDSVEFTLEDCMVAMLPNEKLTSSLAELSFGGAGSTIYSDYVIHIPNGYFDMTEMEDECFSFGSSEEQSQIYALTLTLGEADGSEGPTFAGQEVRFGGSPSWFGKLLPEDAPETPVETERLNVTVNKALFTNDVYMNPITGEGDESESILNGSSNITVKDGTFRGNAEFGNGTVYGNVTETISGGMFEKDVYLASGKIIGNLTETVSGGTFKGNVYLASGTVNGSLTEAVTGGTFEGVAKVADGTVLGTVDVNVSGGTFADIYDGSDNANLPEEKNVSLEGATYVLLNGKEPKKGLFGMNPIVLYCISGGVLLAIAGVIIGVSASKKKKKNKKENAS